MTTAHQPMTTAHRANSASEESTGHAGSIGPVPFMSEDMLLPGVLGEWLEDDRLWVPMSSTVSFKPCVLSASNGYFTNVLRVRQNGVLSRHRHAGAVHALVLRGRWHYLEHDWIAEEGSYVYEPPGDIHTLIVPEGVREMMTWFHNSGGYTYVNEAGSPVGYEDVFTKIEAARRHYRSIGLAEDYVQRFIR